MASVRLPIFAKLNKNFIKSFMKLQNYLNVYVLWFYLELHAMQAILMS